MKTKEDISDQQAVINHAFLRVPVDPEVEKRIRERARRATEETLRRFGVQEICTQLIRETRDEC